MLLDSGGYFESGYATDTTRSFFSGGNPNAKQKEIYTLVLKSLLHAMNAVFPAGTWGSMIDGVTRQPMFKFGYNFQHGTGHGVGINVHEGGYRISTVSSVPLKENLVGSLEPGIYIPGFGGVRLENVVAVEKHPKLEGMLCFRSLVFIGYDHDLIDKNIMTQEELAWLETYERECAIKGRSFIYN
jgi:Xaa-Pro aminopeptidase